MLAYEETMLEQCPFCGSYDVTFAQAPKKMARPWKILCESCGAEGPHADTWEKAAELWKCRRYSNGDQL